jgi:CheY-like chemotaxis protein
MADCYVLVVDPDEGFCARVAHLLPRTGVRLVATDSEGETLELLARHRPKLVFIAVELPGKEGFSLFSKIKKAQRNVPVVLTTASVSKADMKMHENLRVHADAYVDKRTLSNEELCDILEPRVGISMEALSGENGTDPHRDGSGEAPDPHPLPEEELDDREDAEPAASADAVETEHSDETEAKRERRPVELDPRLTQFLDPATAAIFAEIDEETAELAAGSTSTSGELTPQRLAELEAQIARLEDQLAQARSDAQSSPFSSDFVTLREAANRKQEEIDELKKTLTRRDGYVLVVKRKLAELAIKLIELQKEHEQSAEEATGWKERLDATNRKLAHVADELEEQQKLHEREVEALKELLAEEQVRVTVTRHELEGQLAELRAERSKIVQQSDQARSSALKELETILRDEKATAIAELKEKYTAKLKELDESRSRTTAELRAEHDKTIAALRESHAEALERAAAEAQDTLREVSEKSAEALEHANEQRVAELARAEEKRAADLEALEKAQASKIEALARQHQAEREDLEKKAEAAVGANEAMLEEVNAKVQDVLMSWEKERQSHHETRERYEKNLAQLQAVHTKHLEQAEQDQFSVLAGLSRKFRDERTSALDAERARGEQKLEELSQTHAAELASVQNRHQEQIASLNQAHESELANRERERDQGIADAVSRATAQLTADNEQTRRAHADELALLRRSHEKDIAAFQSTHMEALAKKDQESQQALREAVAQAKTDTNEQIEQIEAEHSRALATLRTDYEDELRTLEEVHRTTLAQQEDAARATLQRVEDERDEARGGADALRAELAELEAKHRSDFAMLEEQHKADLKDLKQRAKTKTSQLEDEKQFLGASVEKLKRQSAAELKRATDALTHEKQLHQGTRERYERRVTELKERHAEGLKRVETDWMQKLEHLENNLNQRSEKAVSAAEREWKTKLEKTRIQHEESVASLRHEAELEVAALQQRLERSAELEESHERLSHELAALKKQVDSLSEELSRAHYELAERNQLLAEHTEHAANNAESAKSLGEELSRVRHELSDRDQLIAEHARELATSRERIDSLGEELSRAQHELSERNQIIAEHTKKVMDNKETIDSLKAVINDFSQSVGGYLQDRNDQAQTISALKEVISDMYRSIEQVEESS